MPLRILLVEDEPDYRDALRDILNLEGFVADGVGTISSFVAWRRTHSFDVLIVDRHLPDGDGLEVVKLHRQADNSPVIVLTARGQVEDRVAGMNADADHYLVKPVAIAELIALLRRLERRSQAQGEPQSWVLDPVSWRLHPPVGADVSLTHREILLLGPFVERAGLTVTREEIVRGLNEDPTLFDPRRLEVMVRRLRTKVEEATAAELPLSTVYGVGYVFNGLLAKR